MTEIGNKRIREPLNEPPYSDNFWPNSRDFENNCATTVVNHPSPLHWGWFPATVWLLPAYYQPIAVYYQPIPPHEQPLPWLIKDIDSETMPYTTENGQ